MGLLHAKIVNIESVLIVVPLESKSICLPNSEEFRLVGVVPLICGL